MCVAELLLWTAQAKGELWTRSWETMPLPLSQAAVAMAASKPAAAPASWLAQHRAAQVLQPQRQAHTGDIKER